MGRKERQRGGYRSPAEAGPIAQQNTSPDAADEHVFGGGSPPPSMATPHPEEAGKPAAARELPKPARPAPSQERPDVGPISVTLPPAAIGTLPASRREVSMGRLTRDMSRLHDQIVSAKMQRRDLMQGLKKSSDLRKEGVGQMTAGFRGARMEMKKRMAESHARFLGQLRNSVAGLRNELAADLTGARMAFMGGRS